ncbi:putative sensor domain DACNV-containing protein [Geomesophilobacter sediminis]|uniref:DNA integrity scanning protein DisA nucleotide-binding domain protein n=1 Tax=Geomesophilobacter sediminis TaxID=2798584 RepID=A0A8J7JEQ6_9BACT|nr:diadenylate cyclase [Geomesophilobacter sediminis]MBJ6726203.1 DNA integrity scanning protein DisA nucleotide-binding domain protein [Geomesophilobacter sediminis]
MSKMTGCKKSDRHAYPRELVDFIYEQWQNPSFLEKIGGEGDTASLQLPECRQLEQVISICYQASLMREEERPVMFRLIIREPRLFPAEDGPPTGLHRLLFTRPRPFNEYELHRLAPAADFYRTLIGLTIDPVHGTQIWGLVHSGTRWMHSVYGGRKTFPPLPRSLVVYVTGPGQISVCLGEEIIASLNGGDINCPTLDVFNSSWIAHSLAAVRTETWELHQAARARAEKPWALLDPEFGKSVGQQVMRRLISVIRNAGHGGMLVYLPTEMTEEILAENRYMTIKYQFLEYESRQRFRNLTLRIMNTLAEIYGDPEDPHKRVGWLEYVNSKHEAIALLDEAIFDVAHLLAVLAGIDGAVVLTKRQELLGFGGVILGDIDNVGMVAHALDTEGTRTEPVLSEGVGTRHRAAYRLCQKLHDAIAIVISQDKSVQIVKWHNGFVTYWDQVPTGVPGF